MASYAQKQKRRLAMKLHKAGRKRKNKMSKRSTLSYAELFARCGEPGKPAPKQQ